MMRRRRWRSDVEDIQDNLVVQEGMIVKFPLVPVATFTAPASRFSNNNKLSNHIVKIHKDPTS